MMGYAIHSRSQRARRFLLIMAIALAMVSSSRTTFGQRTGFGANRLAPSLEGGTQWINTDGPLDLKTFRGKFVLLDFWTYCCINCMHILPELKKLEHAFPKNLVVIGVHSGKFDEEKDSDNIRAAVLRYNIEHPVINDSNYAIWQRWGIDTWPSLRLIDPEGNLVWGINGEVEFEILQRELKSRIASYRRKGVLNETPIEFNRERRRAQESPLLFPGKVLADAATGRLFVADSNHNRIVVCETSGKLIDVIGNGDIGRADGSYADASFQQPQGMALDGKMLYIADTENHLLRKIDLEARQVRTIAGSGKQRRELHPATRRNLGNPLRTPLSSPWDLCLHDDVLYIAMAGPHQIWQMSLDEKQIGVHAGNGIEDIVDGPLARSSNSSGGASFAQPSGLATDGDVLYVADSEGSSVRVVPFQANQKVTTLVGTAGLRGSRLFTFGDDDGPAERARFQHPLGIAFADGRLYVADTYNDKLRAIDLGERIVSTIAGTGKAGSNDEPPEFDEPGGISASAGKLYIADTNNHAVRVLNLEDKTVSTLAIEGLQPPVKVQAAAKPALADPKFVQLRPADVKPQDGAIKLHISVKLPNGYKINEAAPTQYWIETESSAGPIGRVALNHLTKLAPPAADFKISLPLASEQGSETLKVSFMYYYCEEAGSGLCKVGSVVWTVPVRLTDTVDSDTIQLTHRAP
jgi:DNA-binding beta-propeller fold protein YncE